MLPGIVSPNVNGQTRRMRAAGTCRSTRVRLPSSMASDESKQVDSAGSGAVEGGAQSEWTKFRFELFPGRSVDDALPAFPRTRTHSRCAALPVGGGRVDRWLHIMYIDALSNAAEVRAAIRGRELDAAVMDAGTVRDALRTHTHAYVLPAVL